MRLVRLPGASGRFARIDGRLPSERDLDRIARLGSLHVLSLPVGVTDLSFLAPIAPSLIRLIVTDYFCTDASVVADCTSLEELELSVDQRAPIETARLTRLRVVGADWGHGTQALFAVPSLKEASVTRPPSSIAERICPGVQRLRLLSGARVHSLDGARVPKLQSFELADTAEFDAASLVPCRGLREIEFAGIRRVRNLAPLSTHVDLDRIVLHEVYDVGDLSELATLRAGTVLVIGDPTRLVPLVSVLRSAPVNYLQLPPSL